MPTPKQHIEELYTEISKPSRNTKTSAQATNKIAKQALTGTVYITELLQNADDAKLKDAQGKNTKIAARSASFIVEGEYLIFQHDGRHFSPEDVEGICDIANPDREKVIDPDVIGNKGLGFKSLFNIADEVGIVSSEYTFCFNKNHEAWASNPQSVPWQIIPIWKEKSEFPAHVLRHLENDRVSFIIKLKPINQAAVIEALQQVLNTDGRVLLFLRSVQELNIQMDGQLRVITKSNSPLQDAFHQVSIGVDAASKKSWVVYTYKQKVPAHVKKLVEEDPDLPAKYTTQHSGYVDVQLAAPMGASSLAHQNASNIFCFLPTSIQSGLPFVVNSEFFLDLARKDFSDQPAATAWNHMILSDVYVQQFKLLQFLANSGHWETVLRYIAFPSDNKFLMTQEMKKSITDRFKIEKLNYAFVADQNGKPRKIKEVCDDVDDFITSIGFKEQYKNIVHNDLDAYENLSRLGVAAYTPNEIIAFLKQENFRLYLASPQTNRLLIKWLGSVLEGMKNNPSLEQFVNDLKQTEFILTDQKELAAPKEIFLPTDEFDYINAEENIVNIIHSAYKDERSILFFQSKLGIKPLTTGEIINCLNKKGNDDLRVRTIKILFKLYCAMQEPDRAEFAKKWNGLKLKTKAGLAESRECYLPDLLNPEFPLGFDYGRQIDADTYVDIQEYISLWQTFFLAIGVQQTLLPTNIKNIVKAANESKNNTHHLAFIRRLKTQLFPDDQALPLLEDCKGLELLTTTDGYVRADVVYLANDYNPVMPLQAHALDLDFISTEYRTAADEALSWKNFFLFLGVQEKLSFTSRRIIAVSSDIASNTATDLYVTWLAREHDVHQGGTGQYKHQHSISRVHEIKYFEIIKSAPIFWGVLWREWSAVYEAITETVTYKTRFGSYDVPSSIVFLLDEAAKAQYSTTLSERYSPKIREILGDGYDLPYFFDHGHTLTDEQIDTLKLKKQLSFADAIKILAILSTKPPKDNLTQVHLKYIYQQIILIEEIWDVSDEELAQLKLLNEKEDFVDTPQLYACDTQDIKLRPNAQLMKRFSDISMSDFKLLYQRLQVKKVEMVVAPVNEVLDQQVTSKIKSKLVLLSLVECKAQDVTEDAFEKCYQQYIRDFFAKPLTFIKCDSLVVTGSVQETSKVWINKSAAKIYYVDECDVAFLTDHYVQIAQIYNWKMPVGDFIKVLLRSEASICEEFNLLDNQLLEITQFIQQMDSPVMASVVIKAQAVSDVSVTQQQMQTSTSSPSSLLANTTAVIPLPVDLQNQHTIDTGLVNHTAVTEQVAVVTSNTRSSQVGDLQLPTTSAQMTIVHPVGNASQSEYQPGKFKRTFEMYNDGDESDDQKGSSSSSQAQPLSMVPISTQRQTAMDDTGKKGEAYLLNFLRQRYKNKHPDCQFIETSDGCILQKEGYQKEITWLNKNGEAGKPYDYMIVTTTPQGKKHA